MLQQTIRNVFVPLTAVLQSITDEQYSQPCAALSGASIGQHVRHIIELFQCLEEGYASGLINYENRRRDQEIETKAGVALSCIGHILSQLDKPDKGLTLEASYDHPDNAVVQMATNYQRELAYNLEHTIHHMALIRIGINAASLVELPAGFGVAPSTQKYRTQCAQ